MKIVKVIPLRTLASSSLLPNHNALVAITTRSCASKTWIQQNPILCLTGVPGETKVDLHNGFEMVVVAQNG